MNKHPHYERDLRRYLYILPLMLLLVFVYLYPIIRTVNYSLYKLPFGGAEGTFVGLQNFIDLFEDPIFWRSLKNNIIWAFGNLILQMVLAFIIAAVLNTKFRGMSVVRTVVLLPWIIPTAAVACVIRWVLLPNLGIVNEMLVSSRLVNSAVNFLGVDNAMKTLIVLNSWKSIPIGVLLILSALQTIPCDVYESAQIDGANAFQAFFRITYPIISKMLWFTSFLIFVWGFNAFDMIWMITQGGPDIITQTLPVMVYRSAFKTMQLGLSSAIAVVIALILIVIGITYFSLMAKGNLNE
jgi:multiple sugar transport system permease protein